MDKQKQIDKIVEWMRWRTIIVNGSWSYDLSPHGSIKHTDFDPFTSTQNCAMVMKEIAKRKIHYTVSFQPMAINGRKFMAFMIIDHPSYGYSDESEENAKMLALVGAINK